MKPHRSYIPASTILPETTVKAIILGFILSAVLSAANAYLGLLVGMTVSASIPAAVISMAVLKAFRKSNILENNAVQTAASAGESLAAGVIFTFPALILMGHWQQFNYLETFLIALCGGVLGILFTIPLRRALIVKEQLLFPEGIATSEVLKTGEKSNQGIKYLIQGSAVGAFIQFLIAGLRLLPDKFELATAIKAKGYVYFGTWLSPAVMAVGYIVGLNIAVLVFIGGAISWFIAIPAYIGFSGTEIGPDPISTGKMIWSTKIRYLGVGAMVVGGLWALISVRNSLASAVGQGIEAFKKSKETGATVLRTDYDTPMSWVMVGIGAMIVPIFIIYLREIQDIPVTAIMSIIMLITGFLFSAVAGYMAGLVGSSNNPISGVTIATILTSSLILLALKGTGSSIGAPAAILIGAVVCCAAAIAGDNMQDLKAGYLLGATPYRQQIMQVVGVLSAALVIPLVLNVLHSGYVIGSEKLSAPQASLMQSVADGVFSQSLPWGLISIGAGIGIVIIIIDQMLAARNSSFRMPVLAVAVGLYLPLYLDTGILIGGLIAWFVSRYQQKRRKEVTDFDAAVHSSTNTGVLVASGLITGEALVGILLAIPIALKGSDRLFENFDYQVPQIFGLVILLSIGTWIYKTVASNFKN